MEASTTNRGSLRIISATTSPSGIAWKDGRQFVAGDMIAIRGVGSGANPARWTAAYANSQTVGWKSK